MRISMQVVYENLEKFHPVRKRVRGWDTLKYLGFFCWRKDRQEMPDDFILVGGAEELEQAKIPEKCGVICIGNCGKNPGKGQEWVILPNETELECLCDALQVIFRKYQVWDERLCEILRSNQEIECYCQASIDIFENPVFVHDGNFEIISSVNEMPGQVTWNYEQESGKKTVMMETMNDFKISPDYQDSLITRGARIFPSQQFGYRGLYVNFWQEHTFIGRICINELGRKFRESDYQLLEYLAEYIQTALERGCLLQTDDPRDLEQSFYELLQHGSTDEGLLRKRLEYQKWSAEDMFLCIRLLVSSRDYSTHAIAYTCRRLENMFAGIYVFVFQEGITLVVNKDKINSTITNFYQSLAVFLREGLFKAGVSAEGKGFINLRYYYRQCIAALQMGEKENSMFWMYKFEDYAIPYLFYQGSRLLEPEMYCEPSLLKLREYDEVHSTDFYETIRVYLENDRNLAHTAARLYVHRSTLLYRLEKIKKLTGLNLDDHNVRFKLLLSYEILKQKKI